MCWLTLATLFEKTLFNNSLFLLYNLARKLDFVLKLVLDDATVITNFYTFIGFEDEESIKLIPVKITKENMYTIDPTRIVSFNWYYLESDKIVEYV